MGGYAHRGLPALEVALASRGEVEVGAVVPASPDGGRGLGEAAAKLPRPVAAAAMRGEARVDARGV